MESLNAERSAVCRIKFHPSTLACLATSKLVGTFRRLATLTFKYLFPQICSYKLRTNQKPLGAGNFNVTNHQDIGNHCLAKLRNMALSWFLAASETAVAPETAWAFASAPAIKSCLGCESFTPKLKMPEKYRTDTKQTSSQRFWKTSKQVHRYIYIYVLHLCNSITVAIKVNCVFPKCFINPNHRS